MRRAGLGLFFAGLAVAGALTASVLAGTSPTLGGSTESSTATTDTTATTATETATTETAETTPITTAPKPRPKKPKPRPRPTPVRLPAGVTVGGVHVGGLTPAAAYDAVRAAFESPLIVLVGAKRATASPGELGAAAYVKPAIARARSATPRTGVPLVVSVRGRAVRDFVGSLAARFDRKPIDAKVVLRDRKPFVTEDAPGLSVDRRGAAAAIVAALKANRRSPLKLLARNLKPPVTRDGFGPVIVIRRDSRRLFLYDGVRLEHRFVVATGQPTYPTPLGRLTIVVKWRNPWWYPPPSPWARGLRPVPPGPGNPLGTRWMGLSASGVGIHGTPDEASLGYSLSHGCIRMRIPEAEWLFDHVKIGTTVFIVAG